MTTRGLVYCLLVTLCLGAGWANGQATIYVSRDGLCSGHSPCYSTIQGAIDAVSLPSAIKITQETYQEDVVLDVDQLMALEGGWDTGFASCSSYTMINGSLTITDGTVVIGGIGRIIVSSLPPTIDSFSASPATINLGSSSTLSWTITNATSASINQGVGVVNSSSGSTSVSPTSTTTYTLTATNAAGFVTAQATVTVIVPPTINVFSVDPATINVGGSSTLSWTITNATSASIDNGVGSINPISGSVDVSPTTTTTYTLTAANGAGSVTAQITVTVTVTPPPDPATVAPPIDPTVATTVFSATEFLYTGGAPIQTGVAPGTIEPKRVAVLRGKVLDRNSAPLPGVKITVLNHPEYGQTLSRTDGMFDMAVNGGGYLDLKYQKSGYLEVQRQLNVPWQDYIWAPDVVLISLDPVATSVDLTSTTPIQVAQGSTVQDARGTRQSTLLFSQGTQAELVLADGSTQPISNLTVRSTEYTVGQNGPNAMPGDLPLGIGYTYAVELSVDEALVAGASEVRFSQPVVNYVENFLGFDVGIDVPVYYFDRKKSIWIPSPHGRIIKVLGSTGGMADLDVDGDDVADTESKLSDLGISDQERQRLTGLYSAGQSLWRVRLLHFTPIDYNYPRYLRDPSQDPPATSPGKDEDDPCESSGASVIECQNQKLGESIPVTGTAFTLNYSSGRLPGRVISNTLVIPLTGSTLRYPGYFLGVEVKIEVAGRQFSYSYPAAPDLSHTFTWDGLDAYGRRLQGAQPIRVSLGYRYVGRRCNPPRYCNFYPGWVPDDIYWKDWYGKIRHWDYTQSIGGWTLSVHHNYDPAAKTIHFGTGDQQSAANHSLVIDTVAGNGKTACFPTTDPCGDGGPATSAKIGYVYGVTPAPDGSLYLPVRELYRVRRVSSDGIITTAAGSGNWCTSGTDPCGDGGPATQAGFGEFYMTALGPDGSIYIAEWERNRIRRVGPNGIITTVAGTGVAGFSGDGGPATQARLNYPAGIAVTPDGNLFVADGGNYRIRKVGPDGIITTVAGNGTNCSPGLASTIPCGDGGPASQASLYTENLFVAGDGTIYIGSWCRIRKVTPDGLIQHVAGTGECGFSGDGGVATEARFSIIKGITIAPDGSLLVVHEGPSSDTRGHRVRRISPDGLVSTIAGTGVSGYDGDGGAAAASNLSMAWGIAVGSDGYIYIADVMSSRIRRLKPLLPGFTANDILITSQDGKELYFFDSTGRHLRTVNTFTGAVIYEFTYNTQGKLTQIKDGDNNITSVERDTSGNPTAVVGHYGQRTILSLDFNGLLAGITNPAGETTSFEYTGVGLLTKITSPRGYSSNMTYDSLGRLIKDEDPAGGYQALSRTELPNGYEVTRTTAMGQTTTYRVESLSTGDKQITNTFPDGTQTTSVLKPVATQTITVADGTVTTFEQGPDPRFGMQSPVPKSMTVLTPGGLTYSLGFTRSVSLSNANDPLSLTSLTDSMTVNNRTYQSLYSVAARQQTSTSPQGRQTVTTLDTLGRVVKKERAGIDPISLVYDANGRLTTISQGTAETLRNITLSYNPAGYVSSVTDPLSRTVSFEYDQAGRVTRQILPGGREVLYGYDTNGNLTSLTPPSRSSHAFNYTPVDGVKDYTPPPAGPDTGPTTYTYNADRQLTQVTRPDGKTINLAYDTVGRLSTRAIQRGTTTYAYDTQTNNISSITAPDGGLISFTYDGSLIKGTTWQGMVQGSLGLTYDNNFRVVSKSVNGGNTINFTYDNDSLLTQAGDLNISRNSQNGLITGTTLGAVTDTRLYNTFGELSDYSVSANASEIFRVLYTRDKLGRVTEKTETISGVSKTYNYLYDAAGRLAEVKEDGSTVATYAYDGNGNRVTTNTGIPVVATYDDQDRLLQYGSTTYSYTGNGELASKTAGAQTTIYQYDELRNFIAVTLPGGTQVEYVIDGRNRRIGKKVNNVLVQGLLYKDRLNPVAELDGSGTLVSRFVYGTKKNAPDYMLKGGATYRIISDHLGSVRLVVDVNTGAPIQQITYDAFGNIISDTNPGFQPFGFAGGLNDLDTRLTRFGVRDYDAETGRWTAKDPVGFDGGDANFYAYVQNNPVMLIDPLGTTSLGDIARGVHETLKTAANDAKDWVKEKLSKAKKAAEDTFGSDNVNDCLDTAWNFLSNVMCAVVPDIVGPACTIGTGATGEEGAKDVYRGVEHLSGKGERWEKLKEVEF